MNKLKHPLYSQRNWIFIVGILMVLLLLVYPFDLWVGRIILAILGAMLLLGWRRNWLQHLSALKWFNDMEGTDDDTALDEN